MPRTVIHYTDSAVFGGAEGALVTLLGSLDRRHWTPVLFHHGAPGIRPMLEEAGRLEVRTRCVTRVRVARDLARLIGEVRSERAAVFHAHLPWALRCGSGLVAAAVARVPAVLATQQLFAGIGSRRGALRQWAVAVGVDRYIAVSAAMAKKLRETRFFPSRKVVVIRNAVDSRRFPPEPDAGLPRAIGGAPARPVVLSLARLEPQKGLADLLQAAVHVPEATFLVAGEGAERARLESLARTLGVDGRVTFLGYRDDIPRLLASCDLFVLPSLYEGLPISVLEAMAAGKPVVATAIAGTEEAVSGGETGLLVPPGDPPALAEAIRSVISDPRRAEQFGRAGRERALREFSAEKMVREVTRLYEQVLSAGRASEV
jgi:glycosyltransferase involved in cell wall biosynthesis